MWFYDHVGPCNMWKSPSGIQKLPWMSKCSEDAAYTVVLNRKYWQVTQVHHSIRGEQGRLPFMQTILP
jgi:hypothetical protein